MAPFDLTLCAFENDPMGTRVTETAVPHDDCCIGFDGLEAMLTVAGMSHCYLSLTLLVVSSGNSNVAARPLPRASVAEHG